MYNSSGARIFGNNVEFMLVTKDPSFPFVIVADCPTCKHPACINLAESCYDVININQPMKINDFYCNTCEKNFVVEIKINLNISYAKIIKEKTD